MRIRRHARVPKGTIQYQRNLHYRYCIVNSTPRFYIGFVTLMSTMSENGMNYLELEYEKKKQALKNRIEVLDAEQDALKAEIVAYADSKGYMSLKGEEGKILIRHERKAELPQDKTQLIARLKQTGQYDSLSMPNYSRIRSDIVKGTADPEIAKMANIENVDKIYVKKKDE